MSRSAVFTPVMSPNRVSVENRPSHEISRSSRCCVRKSNSAFARSNLAIAFVVMAAKVSRACWLARMSWLSCSRWPCPSSRAAAPCGLTPASWSTWNEHSWRCSSCPCLGPKCNAAPHPIRVSVSLGRLALVGAVTRLARVETTGRPAVGVRISPAYQNARLRARSLAGSQPYRPSFVPTTCPQLGLQTHSPPRFVSISLTIGHTFR